MNSLRITSALVAASLILAIPFAAAKPHYANDETQRIIEAMVDAHGGIDRWRAAPAIRYDDIMHNSFAGKDQFAFWVAHEVIDQKTRQVWQDWPMDNARIGYDGKQVWSENWQKGNPSASMVHFFYYFVNLPWITQDDGVILSEASMFTWPGIEQELYEIRMTFDAAPAIGKSVKNYYVLYIDPESYRLVGYQYANGYKPLIEKMGLPEGKEVFGPMWRFITRYQEVDGLLFATAFHTMPEPDGRIVGNHLILNLDISTPFEYEKSKMPANADRFNGPLTTD